MGGKLTKKTPPLPAVFSGCPERKERRKRNGHPKLLFGPKVQRRENVGGSLKTLGPIKSNDFHPLTNRNIIHKKQFVKYFVKFFSKFIFWEFFLGKGAITTRLNLFKKSNIIRMLNWKTNKTIGEIS